jgi:hypothetical protein
LFALVLVRICFSLIGVMSIYPLSRELESAVGDLFAREEFLSLQQLSQNDLPGYIRALRLLKSANPSAFQIQKTGAVENHPGDLLMWEILTARERERTSRVELSEDCGASSAEPEEVSLQARLAVERLASLQRRGHGQHAA